MTGKRIHMARRRRAVLARYEEFVRLLTPTNLRTVDSAVRPLVVEAIRHSYPKEILVYVWRGEISFDEIVKRARERISIAQPTFEWSQP